MKIAVPSTGQTLEDPADTRFGRARYFILIDSDTMDHQAVENPGASAQGGAGIAAAQAVADRQAGAVITHQCGMNAARVFQSAGIELIQAVPGTVGELVQKYNEGALKPLTGIHAGYHSGR